MKRGQVRVMGALVLAAAFASFGANPALAQLKSVQGILSGVVRDTVGTPQMGASVELIPEWIASASPLDFFTNTEGVFRGERLVPGFVHRARHPCRFSADPRKAHPCQRQSHHACSHSVGIHLRIARAIAAYSFFRRQRNRRLDMGAAHGHFCPPSPSVGRGRSA